MGYSKHAKRLLGDAEDVISRYLDGEITEEYLQNSIDAISDSLDSSVDAEMRELFALFPDKIEEIIFMEFPKNRRKLVELEANKLKRVISDSLSVQ